MNQSEASTIRHRSRLALSYAVPIGMLGGLIGLGGAEFRLPVLAGPLGYSARQAVPLNLAVSLITLGASLVIRGRTLSFDPLLAYVPIVLAMIAGAVVTAFWGAAWASRLSNERLSRIILILLIVIGWALIIEGLLPQAAAGFVPATTVWQIVTGVCFGLAIGLVSSLLGVAGGELIIPTLVFAYGADIKTAGTASLLISLPTVLVGVLRYAERGAFAQRRDLTETVAPMGCGSIVGAVLGGLLVGSVSVTLLKILLGLILNISAWRIFRHSRDARTRTAAAQQRKPSS